jgi:hypothetical protein
MTFLQRLDAGIFNILWSREVRLADRNISDPFAATFQLIAESENPSHLGMVDLVQSIRLFECHGYPSWFYDVKLPSLQVSSGYSCSLPSL